MYFQISDYLHIENAGSDILLEPGDTFLFKKGDFQKPLESSACEYYYVHFTTEPVAEFDVTEEEYRSLVLNKKNPFSVFVFIFRKPVLEILTDSPEIIALAAKVMFVDIFVQLARGSSNIGDQLLTANGDVKIVSAVSLSACCGVTVLFAWLLGINLSLGLVGCWIAFLLEEIYKSSFYVLRWKNGKWKNQKI